MRNKIIVIMICINMIMVTYASTYVYDLPEVETNAPVFTMQSASQLLIEPYTGKVIYENNADERLFPASVTKIMTILLLMEAIDEGKVEYTDKVRCSSNACGLGGSQIWFKENEELTVDECLKAICVVSANDVAVAIAEHLGGTTENFVAMMNEKARVLKMENTNFMNPHGIDEEGHYTTARDISKMSVELITRHPKILDYTSIWMDTLRGGTFGLTNTNKLIRFYQGATGLKTGSTSKAGFNLSASATRKDLTFIAVVLKAPSSDIRNAEVKQLLDYGFNNFENVKLLEKNETLGKIKLEKAAIKEIEIVQQENMTYLANRGEGKLISKEIILKEKLKAPLEKGTKVGQILFKKDNKVIEKKDITLERRIPKIKYSEMLVKMIYKEIKF